MPTSITTIASFEVRFRAWSLVFGAGNGRAGDIGGEVHVSQEYTDVGVSLLSRFVPSGESILGVGIDALARGFGR